MHSKADVIWIIEHILYVTIIIRNKVLTTYENLKLKRKWGSHQKGRKQIYSQL